ncbi:MAG: flagellar motor protein [Bdellovibrionaceae bacterium]|nr:flagellar motor protein [Pseudobdellovibrionaceae bacterium]
MILSRRYGKMARMDKASWLGLLVGFGAILLGNLLEGGHVSSLMQLTAFLIVLGGTIGAVMVSSSWKDLSRGVKMFRSAFRAEDEEKFQKSLNEIVDAARVVRKESLVALEPRLARVSDPFVQRVLRNVVDGIEPDITREIGETEIDAEEEDLMGAVKVWMDAGGFSPTIGIIGAVLGLIHVMGNLSDTSKLGAGIAVAFVATVYGVSFANLLFLPIGNKLKKRVARQMRERRVLLEGALQVNSPVNPIIIERKMKAALEGAETF